MKITLSPPGVRPEWLKDDDVVLVWHKDRVRLENLPAWGVHWPTAVAIEIPDDHPYALCQTHGFEWRDPAASNVAPEDWDGGEVLLRDGTRGGGWRWGLCEGREKWDIIGYRKRKDPELVTIPADELAALREAASRAPAVASGAKWKIGDAVRKKRGSSWRGIVCGYYGTDHTPHGYVVNSHFEPGSVQCWPEAALEDWHDWVADMPADAAPAVDAIDPNLKDAREIVARCYDARGNWTIAAEVRRGDCDHWDVVQCALAGIKRGSGTK